MLLLCAHGQTCLASEGRRISLRGLSVRVFLHAGFWRSDFLWPRGDCPPEQCTSSSLQHLSRRLPASMGPSGHLCVLGSVRPLFLRGSHLPAVQPGAPPDRMPRGLWAHVVVSLLGVTVLSCLLFLPREMVQSDSC